MSLFYHLINESEQKFYITSTPVQKKQYFFLKKYWTKGTFWKLLNLYCCEKKTHSRSCWDVKRCFDFRVQTGMTHRLATHVLALTNFNGLLDAILFFSDLSQNFWYKIQSRIFPSILSGCHTGNDVFWFLNLPKLQRGDPYKISNINVVQFCWNFAQLSKMKK